jgi:hypothetical protein
MKTVCEKMLFEVLEIPAAAVIWITILLSCESVCQLECLMFWLCHYNEVINMHSPQIHLSGPGGALDIISLGIIG